MAKNEVKFEDQMKRLEEIVSKLENGDVALDESLKLYEEGLKLSKTLKKQLEAFEEKVSELSKEEDDE